MIYLLKSKTPPTRYPTLTVPKFFHPMPARKGPWDFDQ